MKVVGLGAWCDLAEARVADQREAHFSVGEFAVLGDGRRITLHNERGFGGRLSRNADYWLYQTEESVKRGVLTTVLPDDDDTQDEHPWEWLVTLCRARGIETTVDELKAVPYEVVLSERMVDRLPPEPDESGA